jgi:hypothetical protein
MFTDEVDKLQYTHRTFSIITEDKKEEYMQVVRTRNRDSTGKILTRKEKQARHEFELSVYDELAGTCIHTEKADDIEKAKVRFRELKSEYIFDYQKKLSASKLH